MTKKDIITLMKTKQTATIAFKGLVSPEEVATARQNMINHFQKQIDQTEGATMKIDLDNNSVSFNNGQFFFLPMYPRIGQLVVKSKEFSVDSVYCQFKDICADTYYETDNTQGFMTKANSFVMWNK